MVMNRRDEILIARRNGIKIPVRASRAANKAGIPFYVMCAFLEQESSGGDNVFGHDGGTSGWASGWGEATKAKYVKYRTGRKAGKGMQGVGPMQLTWWEFQDQADALGGCWKPYFNCLVGAQLLHEYWNQHGSWIKVGERYNGAYAYGVEVNKKVEKWKRLLT